MANCKNTQQLNITCGTDVVLHDKLMFDGEVFDPYVSVDIECNLVNSLGKRTTLEYEIADEVLIIQIPWVDGRNAGCYGLEVKGKCNGKTWATYADSLIRYTRSTVEGASVVEVSSDWYDITQVVSYRYSDSPLDEVDATIDDNYGEPEVTTTYEHNKLTLDFKNLRGNGIANVEQTIESLEPEGVNETTITQDNGDTNVIRVRNGKSIVGPSGPQGASAVFDPDTGNILATLENTTGQSDSNAMTQKACTESFPQMADDDNADLDVVDIYGNVLMRLEDGGVKTKEFDSEKIKDIEVGNKDFTDLDFEDESGNVIMKVEDGHIKTKYFDSSEVKPQGIPQLCLPSHIYSYVGDTVQMFKYPILQEANYRDYGVSLWIDSQSANVRKLAKTVGRYFEFIPTTTGRYTIKAAVTDNSLNILTEHSIVVDVVSPTNPSTKKNILLIGDSETMGNTNNSGISVSQGASEEGFYPYSNELKRLLTSNDAAASTAPAGLGLNVQLIGSQNTSGGRHEGYSGWSVQDFLLSSSPFYFNGALNFNSYLAQSSIYEDSTKKGVDVICILLGANGATDVAVDGGKVIPVIKDSYAEGINQLLTAINTQLTTEGAAYYNANLKIMLLSYTFPYVEGRGYHPNGMMPYRDGNLGAKIMKALYEKNCEIAANYNNVDSVCISPFIDSENGFIWMNKQKNIYLTETERVLLEALHPNSMAYKQYAYALTRNIVGII